MTRSLPNVSLHLQTYREWFPSNPVFSPADISEEVTDYAIKAGYRHVDSATAYRNEKPTVDGMLKSGIPRDQLFFTSKVPPKSISYDGAKSSVEESLKQTGYVRLSWASFRMVFFDSYIFGAALTISICTSCTRPTAAKKIVSAPGAL